MKNGWMSGGLERHLVNVLLLDCARLSYGPLGEVDFERSLDGGRR